MLFARNLQSFEDVIKNEYKLHFWKATSQEAYLNDHMAAGSAGQILYQEAVANGHGVKTMADVVELFKNGKGKYSHNCGLAHPSQSLLSNRYCVF